MTVEQCPCGSDSSFADCCQPFLKGAQVPETAEALMRSRFTAFTLRKYGYLTDTSHPNKKQKFSSMQRAQLDKVEWKKLTVKKTEQGGVDDQAGMVHFVVDFQLDGNDDSLEELSRFKKHNNRWCYWDAMPPKEEKADKKEKISRNAPCPCGSGKKYKKCCGHAAAEA